MRFPIFSCIFLMKRKNFATDCRQKAILPPGGGRIALSANERIAEFLNFAIQAKFAYVNKLKFRYSTTAKFKKENENYSINRTATAFPKMRTMRVSPSPPISMGA